MRTTLGGLRDAFRLRHPRRAALLVLVAARAQPAVQPRPPSRLLLSGPRARGGGGGRQIRDDLEGSDHCPVVLPSAGRVSQGSTHACRCLKFETYY